MAFSFWQNSGEKDAWAAKWPCISVRANCMAFLSFSFVSFSRFGKESKDKSFAVGIKYKKQPSIYKNY